MNWRGRRPAGGEVIVNSIAATTIRTGSRVTAALDTNSHPTGVQIGDPDHRPQQQDQDAMSILCEPLGRPPTGHRMRGLRGRVSQR